MKSQYIAIIREQERTIKKLQGVNYLHFLFGFSLGMFLTLLILTILK
jgi:acid phosphatase family membrane protein YuiD